MIGCFEFFLFLRSLFQWIMAIQCPALFYVISFLPNIYPINILMMTLFTTDIITFQIQIVLYVHVVPKQYRPHLIFPVEVIVYDQILNIKNKNLAMINMYNFIEHIPQFAGAIMLQKYDGDVERLLRENPELQDIKGEELWKKYCRPLLGLENIPRSYTQNLYSTHPNPNP